MNVKRKSASDAWLFPLVGLAGTVAAYVQTQRFVEREQSSQLQIRLKDVSLHLQQETNTYIEVLKGAGPVFLRARADAYTLPEHACSKGAY